MKTKFNVKSFQEDGRWFVTIKYPSGEIGMSVDYAHTLYKQLGRAIEKTKWDDKPKSRRVRSA